MTGEAVVETATALGKESRGKTAARAGMFVMPRFRKTEVADAELDAIVAYLTRGPSPGR